MRTTVIDMSQDTMFLLEQIQEFLEYVISKKPEAEVMKRAEQLMELIHIKEEIILHEGQQETLVMVAKEKSKLATEKNKELGKTKTEQYFFEAAIANSRALSNGDYLEKLRKKEFEKIIDIIQSRQKIGEGGTEVCS